MMKMEYGPTFRWFAWHPTATNDRGWRWLRMLNRRRVYWEPSLFDNGGRYFETSVEEF